MIRVHISNRIERKQLDHKEGPLEFGRGPQKDGVPRCVVQDACVSRDHLRIEEQEAGQVRLENLSKRNPVLLPDNTGVWPGETREFNLPLRLLIGETRLLVEPVSLKSSSPEFVDKKVLETIDKPVRAKSISDLNESLLNLGATPSPETLTRWFETVIAVQRAAAGSPEFYQQTARALVELVGLDRGLVLLHRGEVWEVVARSVREGTRGREFSRTILKYVVEERRTFYQASALPLISDDTMASLADLEAVVASPIFDARDQVAGAIYGSRKRVPGGTELGIGHLEAQVVQLLASAVGAGLARLEKEAEATRLRVQFEQFFSPNLAQELQRNPRLLEGQEREITILFCDIRGFSRLAEKLGPSDTCRLVADVMDRLVDRVREFEGVVVDYMGDGLVAMWNAPTDQGEHAVLACRAALGIQGELPQLSKNWEGVLGEPLNLGIGLNTGPALVGNVGSKHKFKYGPLGHTVNLASRVEGATKHLGIPILITQSTAEKVRDTFAVRRLGKHRMVGVSEAIDLYELYVENPTPEWLARRDVYEKALALFESGKWAEACQILYPLVGGADGQHDILCLDLLTRALACLKNPPERFDPTVDFTRK